MRHSATIKANQSRLADRAKSSYDFQYKCSCGAEDTASRVDWLTEVIIEDHPNEKVLLRDYTTRFDTKLVVLDTRKALTVEAAKATNGGAGAPEFPIKIDHPEFGLIEVLVQVPFADSDARGKQVLTELTSGDVEVN